MDCKFASVCVYLSTRVPYLSQALVLCKTCERGTGCLYDLVHFLTEF